MKCMPATNYWTTFSLKEELLKINITMFNFILKSLLKLKMTLHVAELA